MFKKVSLISLIFAVGLILGKYVTEKPRPDVQTQFSDSLRLSLESPDADLSEIFLLLLGNLGLSLRDNQQIIVLEKSEYNSLNQNIEKLKAQVSQLKEVKKEVKQPPKIVIPEEKEISPPSFFLNPGNLLSQLKKSYSLVTPVFIENGKYIFSVDKTVYSNRFPIYIVNVEFNLKHTGHYIEGEMKIELSDGQKVLHSLVQTGVNKDLLLLDEQHLAVKVNKYLVIFDLVKDYDHKEKLALNTKSGELYYIGDRRPTKIGRLNPVD